MPDPRDFLPQPPWEEPPIPKGLMTRTRNPHGSITLTPFKVKSIDKRKELALVGMADTGAIYSALPISVINELGLPHISDTTLILLDGKSVTASMFAGIMEIQGKEIATTFSSLGDGLITIGVTDLEKLGFKVNPATGTLETTAILG